MGVDVSAKVRQAREQMNAGRLGAARATLLAALRADADHAGACGVMSHLMFLSGESAAALHYAERAAAADPENPALYGALGNALAASGRAIDAAGAYRRATELDPRRAANWAALAGALASAHRLSGAESAAREGLRHCPDDPTIARVLGEALVQMARADEGLGLLARALRASPADLEIAQSIAMHLNYASSPDPRRVLEAHRNYARLLDQRLGSASIGPPPALSERDADRRPTIAFLSPDLRAHPVATFLVPLLGGLREEGWPVTCYSVAPREDGVSAALKKQVARWRHVPALDTIALARQVRADRIDVLIDLAGHTSGNRLPVFALRPAPLQMTWLGYPNTTGLSAVDHRIVDARTDPPGSEERMVERALRVEPCFLCYRVPDDAPEPGPPPAIEHGVVTFGSLNTLAKLNDRCIALWSRVLARAPGSRLLLKSKALLDESVRAAVGERFVRAGVNAERLELLPPTGSERDHLLVYRRLDIALDTFPYNGTTTTCEAISMGVPVVTMPGDAHAARVGVSLLRAAGMPEFIGADEAEYEEIAVELARDVPRLSELRRTLRERLQRSALCDSRAFTRAFTSSLRSAWVDACRSPRDSAAVQRGSTA